MEDLLPPFPSSWYCIGLSREFAAGAVKPVRLGSQELVAYRTESGALRLTDAYCPHLGAHLGTTGSVEGETIRCGFHGFCFDGSGQCVSTPYGGRLPPKSRLRSVPVQEIHGLVMAWLGEGEPQWHIPDVETDSWSDWQFHVFRFRGHPQEVAENSVDVGHFGETHKYRQVRTIAAMTHEGPYLTASYGMERPIMFAGRELAAMDAEFTIHQWGLGYARVEVNTPSMGVRTRQMVLACPVGEYAMELRVAMAIQHGALGTVSKVLPAAWLANMLARIGIRQYVHDVSMDVPIWNSKRYLAPPILAEGDGPVGPYRRWARQFYAAAA